ncbi:MAG: DNA polymerase I, partial [Janthinobacterium lividum]
MPDAAPAVEPHLVLIDGSGFIFRAFHALPPMTRQDGTPVNAVYGFSNMLARLLEKHEGTHIAVIFDAGRTTFRNALYSDYKAHRPPPPPELEPQFALVRDATAAFGVASIELPNWEADDLIASYATEASKAGYRTTIISSDKDLMQLIDDRVGMLDPIKQKPIGPEEVFAKFGVAPNKVVEIQALMGDSVDNVPGVPGVGPKNAALLITEHGDVEGVIAAIPSMKPSKRRDILAESIDKMRISRKLVELDRECPLPQPLDSLITRPPDNPVLTRWLISMGFRSTATKLGLFAEAAEPSPEPALFDAPEQPAYGPYVTVTALDALEGWIAEATANGILGLNIQTDGRDPNRAELLGIGLATGPGRACYIPLRHRLPASAAQPNLEGADPAPTLEQIDPAAALAALTPLLTDPAVLKILHNGKAGLLVLDRAGVRASPIDDTMLISYALGAGAHPHGLEDTALRDLGHKAATSDSVTGSGRGRLSFAESPVDRVTAYAAEDPDLALRLWHVLRPRLRTGQALHLYERIERQLVPVLIDMERAGIKVDAEDLRRMSADFADRMAIKETEIHAIAGRPFNLGSPKVLGEVLFDELKMPGGRRMASGAWGTDVSVLQGLADQGHDFPAKVIEWRQLAKLRSTYTEALQQEINPATGRVHTSFGQAITTTGRISSTEPNLQNIPIRTEEGARIRRAFIAEPGHMLVSADYSQIELRLMAHVADIGPLKEAFATGQDIHARTASEVFGVPMEGMDRTTRSRAKAINFGIIYGISGFGLARQLGIEQGEAAQYIRTYFERYPGIRDYMERTKEEARMNGYVLTPFGRRCWVPGIREKIPAKRAYAERQATNAPLQGGAADIIKRAMVQLPAALAASGLSARLLLQVHDELLFEASELEAAATASLAKSVMESAATLSVPLVVETGIGPTWAAA